MPKPFVMLASSAGSQPPKGLRDFFEIYGAYAQETWLLFLQLTLAGLVAGSFCTTLIHRLPLILRGAGHLSLTLPSSHCPRCKRKIALRFNLPLLGYFLARGRCAACNHAISVLYPLTEFSCLLLAWLGGILWGASAITLTALPLFWGLFALAVIDLREGLLPDRITLTLLWLGLLANSFHLWVPLQEAVWGAALGYLFLQMVNWIYRLARGKEGIGGGDMKLLAALGAYFGWQALLPIILMASIGGCVGACVILFLKKRLVHALPWGPFLALAGLVYALLFAWIGPPWPMS